MDYAVHPESTNNSILEVLLRSTDSCRKLLAVRFAVHKKMKLSWITDLAGKPIIVVHPDERSINAMSIHTRDKSGATLSISKGQVLVSFIQYYSNIPSRLITDNFIRGDFANEPWQHLPAG